MDSDIGDSFVRMEKAVSKLESQIREDRITIKILVLTLFLCPVVMLWWSFVLSYLWIWFIVPVTGLRSISVVEALGLALVINYLTYRRKASESVRDRKAVVDSMIHDFTVPMEALSLGYIVSLFL